MVRVYIINNAQGCTVTALYETLSQAKRFVSQHTEALEVRGWECSPAKPGNALLYTKGNKTYLIQWSQTK